MTTKQQLIQMASDSLDNAMAAALLCDGPAASSARTGIAKALNCLQALQVLDEKLENLKWQAAPALQAVRQHIPAQDAHGLIGCQTGMNCNGHCTVSHECPQVKNDSRK
jgi:cell division protein ZapA (FtsZ GTPase activity inhibitor)